jgi:hypothetical protein
MMTDTPPKQADVEAISNTHWVTPGGTFCQECDERWPCGFATLLARIAHLEAENAARTEAGEALADACEANDTECCAACYSYMQDRGDPPIPPDHAPDCPVLRWREVRG